MITLFGQKQDCCGCTACYSICPSQAISMIPDQEGFLYPEIDGAVCTECRLCQEVCAFQNGYDISRNFDTPEVYALKHTSDAVRASNTSGGAFTAISDNILSQGGVVYGAGFANAFRVVHQRAETPDERNQFYGSKYVQSDMGDIFQQVKEDLQTGRHVLFTGTGCQIAGLHRYLVASNVNMDIFIAIDIICHGTPSQKLFNDYIAFLEKKNNSKIVQYIFRSKAKGWRHLEEAVYTNGKRDNSSEFSQLYKVLFSSNICLRPACHQCRFANAKRPGDITLGDFWGIENFYPEFKDDLGVSLVLVNTSKGKIVFYGLSDVVTLPSNIKDCSAKQTNLNKPSAKNPKREAFWQDYQKRGFEFILKKYTKYGRKKSVKARIKHILRRLKV